MKFVLQLITNEIPIYMNEYLPSILRQKVAYKEGVDEGVMVHPFFINPQYPDLSNEIPFIVNDNTPRNSYGNISDGRALERPYLDGGVLVFKGVGCTPHFFSKVLSETEFAVNRTLYPDDVFNRAGAGMCTMEEAKNELKGSEFLKRRNIRTATITGIYTLDAIPTHNGEVISVRQLRNSGRLPYSDIPVILVRHQETNMRVGHFLKTFDQDEASSLDKMKSELFPDNLLEYFQNFIGTFITDFIPIIMEGYQICPLDGNAGGGALMNNLGIYGEKLDVNAFSSSVFNISKPIDEYKKFIADEWNKICVMIFGYSGVLGLDINNLHEAIRISLERAMKKIRIDLLAGKVDNSFLISDKSQFIDVLMQNEWLKK